MGRKIIVENVKYESSKKTDIEDALRGTVVRRSVLTFGIKKLFKKFPSDVYKITIKGTSSDANYFLKAYVYPEVPSYCKEYEDPLLTPAPHMDCHNHRDCKTCEYFQNDKE